MDLRKLLLLRSLLCEGAKMIPQPGAAMLVVGGGLLVQRHSEIGIFIYYSESSSPFRLIVRVKCATCIIGRMTYLTFQYPNSSVVLSRL